MNKIVILGCGYIGTNLANFIAKNYNRDIIVLGKENEYVDYLDKNIKFIPKLIEEITDDDKEIFEKAIVIDAVGNINATNSSKNANIIFLQNCMNRVELIHKCKELEVKKYIFLSSGGTVYEDINTKHKEDEKLSPKNIYALEKIIIENYLKIFSLENDNFRYLILRLSNPYGGIVSKFKRQGIIDVAISKLKKDEELEFYGNLNNVRDYIYIDNASEYIYKIAISKEYNCIFNIGTGKGYTIEQVFSIIEKQYEKKLKLVNKKIKTINITCNI